MRQLSREMDRLMDSFFGRGFGSLLRDSSVGDEDWQAPTLWAPQIDVQHRDDAIVVRADLPGVNKDDVQIDVRDDALVISGQRREEREEGGDDQGYRLLERFHLDSRGEGLAEASEIERSRRRVRRRARHDRRETELLLRHLRHRLLR